MLKILKTGTVNKKLLNILFKPDFEAPELWKGRSSSAKGKTSFLLRYIIWLKINQGSLMMKQISWCLIQPCIFYVTLSDYEYTSFILCLIHLYIQRVSSIGWIAWGRLYPISPARQSVGRLFATLTKYSSVSNTSWKNVQYHIHPFLWFPLSPDQVRSCILL